MIRVLMTADAVGGVWTYATSLTRALPDIEFTLAVMGPPPPRHAASAKVVHAPYRLEWMDDPWDDVARAGDWLLGLEGSLNPDIVHLNGYVHASLPWRAPVLVVAHSCVLSWWTAVMGEMAPASWNRYRDAVAAGIAAADLLAAPSEAMLREIVHFYGSPATSCVIPNGIDLAEFDVRSKESFIFAAGRVWDEAKNLRALDQMFDWPVLVAGDHGSTRFQHARVLGPLSHDNVKDYMARAAIYALPARYEPFGLSVLEAAASGCALVLGDIPSLRENWDGAALFGLQHLPELIENEALRRDYEQRARDRAERFSIARTAASYRRVYESLANQQKRERAA